MKKLILLFFLCACDDCFIGFEKEEVKTNKTLKINKSSKYWIVKGQTDLFSCSIIENDVETLIESGINWQTTDESKATINNSGMLTATEEANIKVIAEYNGMIATHDVAVIMQNLIDINIDQSNLILNIGDEVQLTATGTLSDMSTIPIVNNLFWSAENSNVTVDENGLLKAKNIGMALVNVDFVRETVGGGSVFVTVQ